MHERILAIYDADLSVIGELAYAVGKLTGTRSCALCDITHGLTRSANGHGAAIVRIDPSGVASPQRNL